MFLMLLWASCSNNKRKINNFPETAVSFKNGLQATLMVICSVLF